MNVKGYVAYKKGIDYDSTTVREGPEFKCYMCGRWSNHMKYVLHKKWYPFLKYNMNFLCGPKCSLKAYEKYVGP